MSTSRHTFFFFLGVFYLHTRRKNELCALGNMKMCSYIDATKKYQDIKYKVPSFPMYVCVCWQPLISPF